MPAVRLTRGASAEVGRGWPPAAPGRLRRAHGQARWREMRT